MAMRNSWPAMAQAGLYSETLTGPSNLERRMSPAQRRFDKRKRNAADIARKRNTIIARMIVAISAGALSCTHDEARRLVRSWPDSKVEDVYNEIMQ